MTSANPQCSMSPPRPPPSLPPVTKPVAPPAARVEESKPPARQKVEPLSDEDDGEGSGGQGDVQPVGHDYVEEVGGRAGSTATQEVDVDGWGGRVRLGHRKLMMRPGWDLLAAGAVYFVVIIYCDYL